MISFNLVDLISSNRIERAMVTASKNLSIYQSVSKYKQPLQILERMKPIEEKMKNQINSLVASAAGIVKNTGKVRKTSSKTKVILLGQKLCPKVLRFVI